MITMLFSPKPFVGNNDINQRIALASWRHVLPDAELFCYGDGEGVAKACKDFSARLIRDVPVSNTGAPRFDWIVHHAEKEAKFDLQMFINADIYLLPHFTELLAKIHFPSFLAVSDRLNVPEVLLRNSTLMSLKDELLALIDQGEASFNGGGGSDMFIFKRGFWKTVPELAVGRAGYDNALMAYSIIKHTPLIDVTNAILCLHPKHGYSHVKGGWKTTYEGEDVKKNLEILGTASIPCLCDASHLLFPGGVRRNHRFHGLPHRMLVRTQLLYPQNYLLRFFARAFHFLLTRSGIGRPKNWNARKIIIELEI